jgi:lipid-binding SYLF domain-containing protein
MKFKVVAALAGLSILSVVAGSAIAAPKAELRERADKTLDHFYRLNPANSGLEQKAAGVLIFSRVTKGGIGVGGEWGEGVLQVGGKTVGYYSVGSASVGLTLGLGRHSEIIMFMTPDALTRFQSSHGWSAGADSAIAVVSDGAGGQYDATTLDRPILGFVFGEKGLIGDLSLEGTKITQIKN